MGIVGICLARPQDFHFFVFNLQVLSVAEFHFLQFLCPSEAKQGRQAALAHYAYISPS